MRRLKDGLVITLYQAKEKIEKIALVFDLTEEQVQDAVNFHTRVAA